MDCYLIKALGSVAHLGERLVRNEEVAGSNPVRSTKWNNNQLIRILKKSPNSLQAKTFLLFVYLT